MSAVVPAKRKFADLLRPGIGRLLRSQRIGGTRVVAQPVGAGGVERGAPPPHDRRPVIQDLDHVGVEVISRELII
jgi:hypothetical protein